MFGDRWPTPDGSCVRDFVSVLDLAEAHLLALQNLEPGRMERYNLGSGEGTSVLSLLKTADRLTGQPIPHTFEPVRPGDPAVLVADISRIRDTLGWAPRNSRIEDIFSTALRWHRGAGAEGYLPGATGAAA